MTSKPEQEIDLVEAAIVLASDPSGPAHSYSSLLRHLQPALDRVRSRLGTSATDDEKIDLLNAEVLPAIRRGRLKEFQWLFDSLGSEDGGCAVNVLLYWVAAESVGLPLRPICIPLHGFLLHESAGQRRPIETTDRGQSLTMEEYRALISRDLTHIETLPEESESLKKCAAPITRRQFVALLMCQRGVQSQEGTGILQEATRVAPDFYFPWKVLGGRWGKEKQFEKSEEAMTSAIRLAPYLPGLFAARANLRMRLDKVAAALEDIEVALRLAPHYAQYHLTKSLILFQSERTEAGVAECTVAIQTAPSVADFWRFRGLMRAKLKDYQGAIGDYTKAIELDPKQAVYYERRAEMWAMVGNEENYNADRKRAQELPSRP